MQYFYAIIVAMTAKKTPKLHLEIQKYKGNYYGIIRSSYREGGKVKHTTHGRITGMGLDGLKLVQAALRGDVVLKGSGQEHQVIESKEYGASYVLMEIAKEIGLDKAIYSRSSEQWVRDVLAMVVGRVVYAGSKLGLSNRWADSAIWELSGVEGEVDVNKHCYEAMDKLIKRQEAIQRALARKHLREGSIVLYDITSSYFEGEYEGSEIVEYGYNRDGKKGHEQMVIGLLSTSEGCPVGVEVFRGNTQDGKTVRDKIEEVQKEYGIKEIIFVGDRGMISRANYEKVKGIEGLNIITAMTHREIVELMEREVVEPELFDERDIVEVIDPEDTRIRYCLCKNEKRERKERRTREGLIERTKKALEKISSRKRRSSEQRISAQVGKVLEKTKMGKFVQWCVEDGRLKWSIKEEKIKAEELLDGCYIIKSDVSAKEMCRQEVVASYKRLSLVEQAFRNIKSVRLEVRPVYHKTDERIRCHVFICMLAYYLWWHISKRLEPMIKDSGRGKKRRWTMELVIERLKSIRRQVIVVGGVKCRVVSIPDEEQRRILELLGVKLL